MALEFDNKASIFYTKLFCYVDYCVHIYKELVAFHFQVFQQVFDIKSIASWIANRSMSLLFLDFNMLCIFHEVLKFPPPPHTHTHTHTNIPSEICIPDDEYKLHL